MTRKFIYALSVAGVFFMGEAFSRMQVTELCFLCREGMLSKQEYTQNESDWKQELINIDRKVKTLTLRRNLHQARAERLEDDALRWQSRPDLAPDAQSAWKRFEQEKTLVNELQEEIDRLQQRKMEILKEHNL
ncbi:MAG TPA: hypothetical protein VIJ46_04840 [Rhabdochlamydiaceae bacterium]